MRLRTLPFAVLLLLASLGCPPPHPWDDGGGPPKMYNHSQNGSLAAWYAGTAGASGLWSTSVGSFRYALAGTDKGLRIQSLEASGVFLEVAGPTGPAGTVQRDVETFGTWAYVCSSAVGTPAGVQIVDLSALPSRAPVAGSFLPQDGAPGAINLSIDTARGLLFLQRAQGAEIWDVKADPVHPAFLAQVDTGGPVSDLVAQGTRLYVAEGAARAFSIWDVADAAHPARLSRWTVPGFANCIWPREDGQVVGTLDESPAAPLKLWALNPLAQAVKAGEWSLDGATLGTSLKLRLGRAYLAMREAGLVVLDLADLSKPTLRARFDGPTYEPEPTLRAVREVLPLPQGDPPYPVFTVLVADATKGLVSVSTY
jgi:hypothetical protein